MARHKMQEKAEQLAQMHTSHPNGFTYQDVDQVLGWDRQEFALVVNYIRDVFKDRDYNLVCEPQGFKLPWLYHFTSSPDEARDWLTYREGNLHSALDTVCHVAQSLVQATDSDTIEGKRMRKVERTLRYLRDELTDLREPVPAA